jgi:hypothetical protein
MSIDKFWNNVRGLASGVFRFDVYFADELVPDEAEIRARLRADTNWFRKLAVLWFSEEQFREFLPSEELDQLAGGVSGLKSAVAANDLETGVEAFARVLGVLNFYRYGDLDGLRFGKQIEQRLRERGWPDSLRELRFWRATQHDDFLVLSIYAHLRVAVVKDLPGFLAACNGLRPLLDHLAKEVAPEWFPHVTFRTDELLPEYVNPPDEDEAVPPTRPVVGAAHLPGAA